MGFLNILIRRHQRHLNLFTWLIAVLFLSGCKDSVDPQEICAVGVDVCWTTGGTSYLQINSAAYENRLLPGVTHGYRIPTRVGALYTLLVRQLSGGLRFYVAPGTRVDPGTNTIANRSYPGKFVFVASTTIYSVVVEDLGRPAGSDYSIRVYSYDEPSIPLRDTRHLDVDGSPVQIGLLQNKLIRFEFTVEQGRDYEVQVMTLNGRVDTYLSIIASVDKDVYEQVDSYSDDGITFRADRDGRIYVAVIDRGQPTGSDFKIRIVWL